MKGFDQADGHLPRAGAATVSDFFGGVVLVSFRKVSGSYIYNGLGWIFGQCGDLAMRRQCGVTTIERSHVQYLQ